MYFVWMSVTGILRVLGDGPEEGSEEVVCCERPPLRGRRKSGGGWCTGIDSAVTREWRHDPTRATRVAPQEVMSSRWNDGTESAWHRGSTEFGTRYHFRGKEGDQKKTDKPAPGCADVSEQKGRQNHFYVGNTDKDQETDNNEVPAPKRAEAGIHRKQTTKEQPNSGGRCLRVGREVVTTHVITAAIWLTANPVTSDTRRYPKKAPWQGSRR